MPESEKPPHEKHALIAAEVSKKQAAMNRIDFQLGEIVRLNSGGPAMAIKTIGEEMACIWFNANQEYREACFAAAVLTKEVPSEYGLFGALRRRTAKGFQLGEIVWPKCGGPQMTIKAIGEEMACIWFNASQECHEASFAGVLLSKVAPVIKDDADDQG